MSKRDKYWYNLGSTRDSVTWNQFTSTNSADSWFTEDQKWDYAYGPAPIRENSCPAQGLRFGDCVKIINIPFFEGRIGKVIDTHSQAYSTKYIVQFKNHDLVYNRAFEENNIVKLSVNEYMRYKREK